MEDPLLSVASLHALAYCERLFYLEEVERLRLADAAVFAGRRLHVELAQEEGEELERLEFESGQLGVRGAVDVLRSRGGALIPYEHKRGRAAGSPKLREAWRSDRIQLGAYALLVEEARGCSIEEGRVRYHADRVTVRVPIDAALRDEVRAAVARARALQRTIERPPVTDNDRLCARCSLAPVCLPEEARLGLALAGASSLAAAEAGESGDPGEAGDPGASSSPAAPGVASTADAPAERARSTLRLLPAHPDGQTVHVLEAGASVGRSGDQLVIRGREEDDVHLPVAEVGQIVLHGHAQISTQAIRLCADREIGVHWVTHAGQLVGSLAPSTASAQRHLRQFKALTDEARALELARRLVIGKLESQVRYAARSARGDTGRAAVLDPLCDRLRDALRRAARAESPESLLGHEGTGAAAYFEALAALLSPELGPELAFSGRNRQPPRDRVNAILSYAYGMLYREVLRAVISVGLHPGVGFYHRPRSSAHPLALDLMELFRVPIVDMAVLPAINRRSFDPVADFHELPGRVLLSEPGRRKVIEIVERRLSDSWRHSVVGYSLSYARLIELEVRLLEKEWMGEGGLFAKFRLR